MLLLQVTVWDKVIGTREDASIDDVFLSKYRLVDNGKDLRGRDVNITLAWNIMPYIGKWVGRFGSMRIAYKLVYI